MRGGVPRDLLALAQRLQRMTHVCDLRSYAGRCAVVAVLAGLALIGRPAAPAAASCALLPGTAPPNPYAALPVVFLGTVVTTLEQDRLAIVRVESVWNGPDLPATVEVRGSPALGTPVPAGMGVATSVDRTYQRGQRYLFAPINDRPPFEDNACTPTRVYSPDLEAFRPASARPPLAAGSGNAAAPGLPVTGPLGDLSGVAITAAQWWPFALVVAVGAAAVGAAVAWRVRRRAPARAGVAESGVR